jgi:hypothetical protein
MKTPTNQTVPELEPMAEKETEVRGQKRKGTSGED